MCNFCTKKNLLNERMWDGIPQKLVMGFEKMKSEEDNNYEWEHYWNYYNIIFDTKLLYH
jgi:hypothetical protein